MNVLERFAKFIAPHECLVCNREGDLICVWCINDCFLLLPSRCYRCKKFTKSSAVCTSCRRQTKVKSCWVVTDYDGAAKQVLLKYKFSRAKEAHSIISDSMTAVLPDIPPDTLVVPVPTATRRVRMRGYDHALLIAKDIADKKGLDLLAVVSRFTQTRQVGSDKKHRMEQLQNAFYIKSPVTVRGRKVLIVDDITTSGATLDCMATVLHKAGASQINAVVFAQKQ